MIRIVERCRAARSMPKATLMAKGELELRSPSFKAGFRSATPVSFVVLQWLYSDGEVLPTVGFLSVALSCDLDQIL